MRALSIPAGGLYGAVLGGFFFAALQTVGRLARRAARIRCVIRRSSPSVCASFAAMLASRSASAARASASASPSSAKTASPSASSRPRRDLERERCSSRSRARCIQVAARAAMATATNPSCLRSARAPATPLRTMALPGRRRIASANMSRNRYAAIKRTIPLTRRPVANAASESASANVPSTSIVSCGATPNRRGRSRTYRAAGSSSPGSRWADGSGGRRLPRGCSSTSSRPASAW